MKKVYDLLWKRSQHEGRARWEKVGILIEKTTGKCRSRSLSFPQATGTAGLLEPREKREGRRPRPFKAGSLPGREGLP